MRAIYTIRRLMTHFNIGATLALLAWMHFATPAPEVSSGMNTRPQVPVAAVHR